MWTVWEGDEGHAMTHPFIETADILRDLARVERQDRWANHDLIRRWEAEARDLESLARLDHQ